MLDKVIPQALKKAKPGTPAFRAALKGALESTNGIPITQGVIRFTAKDHFGLEERARMMLTIDKSNWKFVNS